MAKKLLVEQLTQRSELETAQDIENMLNRVEKNVIENGNFDLSFLASKVYRELIYFTVAKKLVSAYQIEAKSYDNKDLQAEERHVRNRLEFRYQCLNAAITASSLLLLKKDILQGEMPQL